MKYESSTVSFFDFIFSGCGGVAEAANMSIFLLSRVLFLQTRLRSHFTEPELLCHAAGISASGQVFKKKILVHMLSTT
jgi:hypothetical protein